MNNPLEIEVGQTYRRGSYQSHGQCEPITVISIEPDHRGWYDDHQGGGWMCKGVATFRFHGPLEEHCDCIGWDAIDYAKDNWIAS